jgi:hypothetical protein
MIKRLHFFFYKLFLQGPLYPGYSPIVLTVVNYGPQYNIQVTNKLKSNKLIN